MGVEIIIDSTVDMMPQDKSKLPTVPLTVHFGDEEYIDGVTISHEAFYEKLGSSAVMPSTSQATPAAFDAVFGQVAARGNSAVVITLSEKFSGTYQSAMIAAEEDADIHVVDSGTVAIGAGILAELAVALAQEGLGAAEIAQRLEQEKQNIRIVAMVDTLEYLQRGGRISKTAAIAGGILNIKPVLSIIDGQIRMLGKARGSKQGNNLLVTEIEKAGGVDFTRPVLLGYTGKSNALLLQYINDSRHLWEAGAESLRYTQIGSVIGTHAGPGAIAVAFFRK